MAQSKRPEVPIEIVERMERICGAFPRCRQEDAWVGVRWRTGQSTVAHLFGGEDQLIRVVFRGEPDEVIAFENLGDPYFRAGWGPNVIGMIIDRDTDWDEVAEVLTDSYVLQASKRDAESVLLRLGIAPRASS